MARVKFLASTIYWKPKQSSRGQRLPVPAGNSSMEPALSTSRAFQSLHLDHSGFPGREMRQNPSNRRPKPCPRHRRVQGQVRPKLKDALKGQNGASLGRFCFWVSCGERRRSTSAFTCQSSLPISDTATAHLNLRSLLLIKERAWFNVLSRPNRGIFLGRPAIPLC